MTKEEFSEAVKNALENGKSARELADKFEVAESTVRSWVSGIANPHPNVKDMIVRELEKE